MSNWGKILRADKLFENQNFERAKKLYLELSKSSKDIFERIDYREKARDAENFKKVLEKALPGEAVFPTVNNEDDGFIYTLKIETSDDTKNKSRLQTGFDNIKSFVTTFINSQFEAYNKNITVFNFGLDNAVIKIKNVLNDNSKDLEVNIWGDSYSLSAAVALMSYIIDEPVSKDFAFSGALEFKNGEIYIREVEKTDEKEAILREERPELQKFFTAKNINTFSELIIELFGEDYLEKLKNSIINTSSINKIYYSYREIETYIGNKIITATLLKFQHEKIPADNLKQLNAFFAAINFSRINNGVIIDGLYPLIGIGMLAQRFVNKINKFVALRSTQTSVPDNLSDKFSNVGIIIYKGKSYSEAEIGDEVYY